MRTYIILSIALAGLLAASPARADKTYSCTAVQNKANTSVGDQASVSVTTATGVCNFSVNGAKSTTAANTNSGGTSGNEARSPVDGSPTAERQFNALRLLLGDPQRLFDRELAREELASILLAPFMGADIPQDRLQSLAISDELLANLPACIDGMFKGVAVFAGADGVFCQSKDAEDGVFSPEMAPSIAVEGRGGLLAIGVSIDDAEFVTFITPEFARAADIVPPMR